MKILFELDPALDREDWRPEWGGNLLLLGEDRDVIAGLRSK